MPADDRERTEAPTGRRRAEARKRGQVARSQEVNTAVILLASLGLFYFMGQSMIQQMIAMVGNGIRELPASDLTPESAYTLLVGWMVEFVKLVGPFTGVLMVAGVAASVLQVGFLMSEEALSPKWERLNPMNGLKNLLSVRNLAELVKSPLKIALVGGIASLTIHQEAATLIQLGDAGPFLSFQLLSRVTFLVLLRVAIALVFLALADYTFQFWQHEKSLRMTREEIKEELKQSEGDPMIRARVKSLQRQMAMRRMMAEVPKASVVVTNPTHLAIALRYDEKTMRAPKVVAKGARLIAERIKDLAKQHGVPLVENKPLAQSLFKSVTIGQEIPSAFYRAVAEILAYVYALKGQWVK
jgi:flagellar biosynthetic protein FlhB